jgi:hypothetical protein
MRQALHPAIYLGAGHDPLDQLPFLAYVPILSYLL